MTESVNDPGARSTEASGHRVRVGVLGTGIMGSGMARSLLAAGLPVKVWNRSPAHAEPLAEWGAEVAATPADAVRDCDVVITMLYDGASVADVVRRAAPGFAPGAIWAQSTTVGPADTPALAELARELSVEFVDAPVMGTRGPAEEGRLLIMATGPAAASERLRPVFDAIGRKTVWIGADATKATATVLKLVANSWVLAVANAAGEALALARATGTDPHAFLEILEGSALDLPYLRAKADAILEDRLAPASFTVTTAQKDAELIARTAAGYGVQLDGTTACAARLERARDLGHGDEDFIASYFASFDID